MFDEKVVKNGPVENCLDEVIQELHYLILSTSIWQVRVTFAQQIPPGTKNRVPEVKNQIEFQEIIDVESFQVLKPQIVAQVDEVLVFKVPVV